MYQNEFEKLKQQLPFQGLCAISWQAPKR